MSTLYDSHFLPRILLVSDGEGDSKTAYKEPLDMAVRMGIIIDVIALLSENEAGKATLEEIAERTHGTFILPSNLDKFVTDFVHLSKKKQATKVEDIVLCLDTSGSMSEFYKGSRQKKIKALKDAVMQFAEKKLAIDPRDRVGVVAFGTKDIDKVIVLLAPAPYDKERLAKAVEMLKPQDGTPLERGIYLAIKELDLANKRAHLDTVTVQVVESIDQLPGQHGTCRYCQATGALQPEISAENWAFFEGVRKVMVFCCPICGSLYHGMCFDKHLTRGGNDGVCYGCNSLLVVEPALEVQTPASSTPQAPMMYLCPSCNEPLPPNARFCAHCGRKLEAGQQPTPVPVPYEVPEKGSSYSTPSVEAQESIYDPDAEQLIACPSCGYSCQKDWDECPICQSRLK